MNRWQSADNACHFFFSPTHENCRCYGSRNSQIVAKTYGSRDNSIAIQASLIKLGMRTKKVIAIITSNEPKEAAILKISLTPHKDI